MNTVKLRADDEGLIAGHTRIAWELMREVELVPIRGEIWLDVRTGESTRRRWQIEPDDAALLDVQRRIAERNGAHPPDEGTPFSWRSVEASTEDELVLHIDDPVARRNALILGIFGFALGTSGPMASAISVYWWPGHELFVGMAFYTIAALVIGPSLTVVALRQRPATNPVRIARQGDDLVIGNTALARGDIRAARFDGDALVVDGSTSVTVPGVHAASEADRAWLVKWMQS